MQVGVNYPWFDYGWDFGAAPPGWRPSPPPRWFAEIDLHLRHFQRLGISVVRWFILGDGLTCGSGDTAPRRDPLLENEWRFDAPDVDRSLLDHFDELLRRFDAVSATGDPIALLPVLLDFHFCEPGIQPVALLDSSGSPATNDPNWVKQGRADAIVNPTIRAAFLDRVLAPLLEVSEAHRNAVYAWELINEPEWITRGWHPDPRAECPIEEDEMRAFLDEGQARIRGAGFQSTVGFASVDTLRASGVVAEINQFHHYPGGTRRLDPHRFQGGCPTILGEFASAPNDIWPELSPTAQTVFDRLTLAANRGYPLAMPWSFRASDRHTSWSDADVLRFSST
jgi:hypothetical protein